MKTEPHELYLLRNRSAIIADGWYGVIAAFGFAPYSTVEVRRRLAELTDQIIDLMLRRRFAADEAKEIGVSLAILHLLQPEVLGQSLKYLFNQLTHDLPAEQVVLLQPRLAELLGEISSGYFSRAQRTILREQEEIRAAFTTAQERLEQSVRRSEERYRTLVESADQAIFIVDHHGVFRFMNGSASNQLGGQPSDFLSKTMWDLFPQDVADSQMASVRSVLAQRRPQLFETVTVLQGKEYWQETSLQPLAKQTEITEAVLGISTDVTARKAAESAMKLYSERLAILRQIDHAILSAQSPRAIAEAALEYVRQVVPCWGINVILYEFEAKQFLVLAGEIKGFVAGLRYPIMAWHMLERLQKGKAVLLADILEIEDLSETWRELRKEGGRALLNVPLIAHGELIGALTVLADRSGIYHVEHAEVASEIASSLAIAIQNARLLQSERDAREENSRLIDQTKQHANQLEQRVEERTRELTALYEVTAIANEHIELQTILDKSLERALITLRCVAATIHQKDDDGQELSVTSRSVVTGGTGILTSFDAIGNRLADEVSKTGRILEIRDLAVYLGHRTKGVGRLRQFVGVPMGVGGELLGVLSAFRDGAMQFSEEEVALLDSIAGHLAGAIENARLRQDAEHLAVLDERSRLARELHDSVTQALYSLTLFAEAAQDRAQEWKIDLVQQHLEEIGATAHQALREMRLLLFELRTSARLDEGLIEALNRRLEAVESRAGVRTHLIADNLQQLPAPLEVGLYRIAQETLNNVLKHAEAASVLVNLTTEDDQVVMVISDDGHGFDQNDVLAQGGGMGLSIMRERVDALNGTLTISSRPEIGTTVTVIAQIGASAL